MQIEEEHRHRCEVREWLRRGEGKDKEWLNRLVKDIAKQRGRMAAERLWRDLKEQWRLGNRGEPNDWRS